MRRNLNNLRVISMLLSLLILIASCSSTTMIQSNPPGATVYMNGQMVGKTPYKHRDSKIVGSMTTINLEKENFDNFNTTLTRDEEVDVGAVIGGIFFLFPFLWTMKYQPWHNYELVPSNTAEVKAMDTKSTSNQFASKAEKLRELKKLLDEKIITADEYDKEKKKILDEN